MDENSINHPDRPNSGSENNKAYLQSKVHNSIDYLVPRQEKQVPFSASSNSMEHNPLKYSYQSKKVLSSISSNSMEHSSSKYLDTHQDKQVFSSVPLKWTAEYSFVKYLDSHEETCSSVGCFIDIENPYYEDDCTPPEMEDSDFILGYSVDPYSEVSRTPPDMEDWEIDSNYDIDPYYEESDSSSEDLWVNNSNYDVDPHYEENDSPPEDDWAFNSNYDVHPYYEESYSYAEDEWACNSNYDVDPYYGERDSPPEDDGRCNSIYDVGPYYEENDSSPTKKDKQVFSNVSSNETLEYSSVKYLDSHQETCPNAGFLRDLESPYYENDCPLSEMKNRDFFLGISFDPYYQDYDSPPEDDWDIYSNFDEENDSPQENDWRFNSNCDVDPYSEVVNECLAAKNEHSLLLRFYEKLVDDLMEKFSIGYFEVCASLQHMIRNHGLVVNGRLPSETNYCDKSYCLGYLHRYAACHAVMISDFVSAILRSSSSNVLNTKLKREQLNVMFLGGGPGNDFVGFLIALYSYRDYLLDLDVTVVDKMSGWEEVFNETVQKLKHNEYVKFYRLFNGVNITTSFISVDLKNCHEWNTDMQNKLKRADLVFLVKVLSHIPNDDKLGVLQNIILYTKPGALLIYVDHPYPKKVFASVSRSLRLVYKSSKKGYNLKATKLKFGYRNIKRCTAEVRVFERQ